MKAFRCERCQDAVPFDATACTRCGAALGYVPDEQTVRAMVPTDESATYEVPGRADRVWRCLNAAWGCNWLVDVGSGTPWCRSCRLTRSRPDTSQPDAIEAWAAAESAKRRVVYQLDALNLPIDGRSEGHRDGLAFDLFYLPGTPAITGHRGGVVTLDLAEVDDHHRAALRHQLGERLRTVIGHVRHEVGHHYWSRLVGQTDHLAEFRSMFGDERMDYSAAVERYYSGESGATTWDPALHITEYAGSHPLEDWAETFAHYLHIVDITETAVAHGIARGGVDAASFDALMGSTDISVVLEVWRPVNGAVDAIAEALGESPLYPFDPTGLVVDKLGFVHDRISAHSARDRFYASPRTNHSPDSRDTRASTPLRS